MPIFNQLPSFFHSVELIFYMPAITSLFIVTWDKMAERISIIYHFVIWFLSPNLLFCFQPHISNNMFRNKMFHPSYIALFCFTIYNELIRLSHKYKSNKKEPLMIKFALAVPRHNFIENALMF